MVNVAIFMVTNSYYMKKLFVLIALVLQSGIVLKSQTKVMFDNNDRITKDEEKAILFREVYAKENNRCQLTEYDKDGHVRKKGYTDDYKWALRNKAVFKIGTWLYYSVDGTLETKQIFSDDVPKIMSPTAANNRSNKLKSFEGIVLTHIRYYLNGQTEDSLSITYKDEKAQKHIYSYHPNGILSRDEISLSTHTQQGTCFDSTGVQCEFVPYELMPEFPGGMDGLLLFINSKLKYPEDAISLRLEDYVYVSFIVGTTGELKNFHITRSSTNYSFNTEAMRVAQLMPPWKPGRFKGNPVDVSYTLPVHFKLR